MKKIIAASLIALSPLVASAQVLPPPAPSMQVKQFTTVGSNTWTVPPGVSVVTVTKFCAAGGGGGGGQASASTAGGGGGGGGNCLENIPMAVTPGATITVVIPDGGTAGTTGNAGSTG